MIGNRRMGVNTVTQRHGVRSWNLTFDSIVGVARHGGRAGRPPLPDTNGTKVFFRFLELSFGTISSKCRSARYIVPQNGTFDANATRLGVRRIHHEKIRGH